MAPVDEPVVPLEEALAPYAARVAERKAGRHHRSSITDAITGRRRARRELGAEPSLEERLAEVITADDPGEGTDRFAARLREAWIEEIEAVPDPEAGGSS